MKFFPRLPRHFFSPFNLLFYLLIVYLAYHMLFGSKGLISYFDLKRQHAARKIELEEIQIQKNQIEAHVHLLDPAEPSADMLEEKAKEQFSFVYDGEFLIINDESELDDD